MADAILVIKCGLLAHHILGVRGRASAMSRWACRDRSRGRTPRRAHREERGRRWSEEYGLTALLVTLVVNLFVLYPSTPAGRVLAVVSDLLLTLLLLAGLLTMGGRRLVRLLFGILILVTIGMRWATLLAWGTPLKSTSALLTLVSLVGITCLVLFQVPRPGPVTAHRIRGAIAGYLLIAAVFAHVYAFIEALAPGSFQMPGWWSREAHDWTEAFNYFSVVTLTTLGYGDITAAHPLARSLVLVEALIGQLYPAILIARLVTLEIEARRSRTGNDDEPR